MIYLLCVKCNAFLFAFIASLHLRKTSCGPSALLISKWPDSCYLRQASNWSVWEAFFSDWPAVLKCAQFDLNVVECLLCNESRRPRSEDFNCPQSWPGLARSPDDIWDFIANIDAGAQTELISTTRVKTLGIFKPKSKLLSQQNPESNKHHKV